MVEHNCTKLISCFALQPQSQHKIPVRERTNKTGTDCKPQSNRTRSALLPAIDGLGLGQIWFLMCRMKISSYSYMVQFKNAFIYQFSTRQIRVREGSLVSKKQVPRQYEVLRQCTEAHSGRELHID